MTYLSLATALLSAAIWLYLSFGRGNFWYLRPFDDDIASHAPPDTWPQITAIVPARNEAETIAPAVTSLLRQNYPGELSIVVVDDHSEDATARLAQNAVEQVDAADRIRIRTASPLPRGWTGKLWALKEGTSTVSSAPDYFWFTDADITHAPDTLTRLVSRATQDHLDLTSLMVLLHAETLAERATIPAFLFFFLKLYPPSWIANTKTRTAGAAGGCILLRTKTLEQIGGLESIRQEVIDDCALARAVKRTGGKIWMGLTRQSVSLRRYSSLAEIRDMIARTAFTQLRYSTLLLAGTLIGLSATYLAPIALLFAHETATRAVALATWLTMFLLFLPTIRYYRLNPIWAAFLPATAAFYAYATFLSAIRHYSNRGAQWKGRSQAPPRDFTVVPGFGHSQNECKVESVGDLERFLPNELRKRAMLWSDAELVLPFADALTAIEIASEKSIAVLGLEAFQVEPSGLQTIDYSGYDREVSFTGNWVAYAQAMNIEASKWVHLHSYGSGCGYILTSASESEFAALDRKNKP